MKYVIAALVFAAALATVDARAEFFSGNKLHELCTDTSDFYRGLCSGFIVGVFDTKVDIDFCTPAGGGVTTRQVEDIVKKHLNVSPEQRHKPAYILVIDALTAAFPCPRVKPGVVRTP